MHKMVVSQFSSQMHISCVQTWRIILYCQEKGLATGAFDHQKKEWNMNNLKITFKVTLKVNLRVTLEMIHSLGIHLP